MDSTKYYFSALLCILLLYSFSKSVLAISKNRSPTKMPSKHVFLIGIDGCRQDAFRKAIHLLRDKKRNPHFLSLIDNGTIDYQIYAGGHTYDKTKQATVSGPGWATVLTGVWANQHLVAENDEILNILAYKGPTVLSYVRENVANADIISMVDWAPLGVLVDHGNSSLNISVVYNASNATQYIKYDKKIAAKATEALKTRNPKLIFTYFGQVDELGHETGFSPNNTHYVNGILTVTDHIDHLVSEIDRRRKEYDEQWLVAVVPDHGGHNFTHGSQAWTDKEIWAIFQDPEDSRYRGGNVLHAIQGQTTIFSTIVDYFQIPIPKNLSIFGKPIMEASKEMMVLQFEINDTVDTIELAPGYPQPISGMQFNISSLLCSCVNHKQEFLYLFLRQNIFVTLDLRDQTIQILRKISTIWPGLEKYSEQIVGCAEDTGHPDVYFFFLSNGSYVGFNQQTRSIAKNYPRKIADDWPALTEKESFQISAVVPMQNDSGYFFVLNSGKIVKSVSQTGEKLSYWLGIYPYQKNIVAVYLWKMTYTAFLTPLPFN